MADMDYLDFDLLIEPAGDRYRAFVTQSPAGVASGEFTPPFSALELENLVLRMGQARGRTRDARSAQRIEQATAVKEFGSRLYQAVFAGPILSCLSRSLDRTREKGQGLRIRLRLAGASDLLNLPWEYMYNADRKRFLALSKHTPLVRYQELSEPLAPLLVRPPLRVLVMVSSPSDEVPLDTESEWQRLAQSLRRLTERRLVELVRLPGATLSDLRMALQDGPYHIFHFVGHGGFGVIAGGELLFETADGRRNPVRAEVVGTLLSDHRSLRLVVLNSCDGARTSVTDPFAGAAQTLIQQGVPAVIAMQFEISDEAAIAFAQGLYGAVASAYSIDGALAEARKAILSQGNEVEWGTPVLYMHAPDGRVFELGERALTVEGEGGSGGGVDIIPLAPVETPPDSDSTVTAGPGTQVAIGGHIIRFDPEHGAVVNVSHELPLLPKARPVPVELLPPDVPNLLGRVAEVGRATEAIGSGEPVEFFAPHGWGKTSLLRYLAHRALRPSHGVAYMQAGGRPASDLLQDLFEIFYETDPGQMPTAGQRQRHLHNVRALIELDDLHVPREDVEVLLEETSGSSFVLASTERTLGEQGRAVRVAGVPEQAGVALVEEELGRPLQPDERAAAASVCQMLDGSPLWILRAAAFAREGGVSLAGLIETLREAVDEEGLTAQEALTARVVTSLSDDERRVMGLLAGLGGAPLHAEHVVALTGLSSAAEVLVSLERRRLAQSDGPMSRICEPVTGPVRDALEVDRWAEEALSYLAGWADRRRGSPELLRDTEAIMSSLALGSEAGRHRDVLRLGQAIEGTLFEARRWGQWEAVLGRELEAARKLGDRSAEAWSLHQLGSRALCLDDPGKAHWYLSSALTVRESLGDGAGAAITQHNLELIGPPPAPTTQVRAAPAPRRVRTRLVLMLTLMALVIAALPVFLLQGGGGSPVVPGLVVRPQRLDFGQVKVGAESLRIETVTVTNEGAAETSIDSRISGPDASGFLVVSNPCVEAPLPPDRTCLIEVAFQPMRTGEHSAFLEVSQQRGAPFEVSLRGIGT